VVGARVGGPAAKVGASVRTGVGGCVGTWTGGRIGGCVGGCVGGWVGTPLGTWVSVSVDIVEVKRLVCVDTAKVNLAELPFPLDPPFALDALIPALIPRRSIELKEGWEIGCDETRNPQSAVTANAVSICVDLVRYR
jgi:hypothetical protein